MLPTGGLARGSGGLAVETYGKFVQVQRITRDGLAGIRETVGTLAEAEGLTRPPRTPSRSASGDAPMSPTPVTFSSPERTGRRYSWEATNEEVAARYGVPLESIVRFDLNTSPTPPALVERLLAAGQFDAPLSEYPPSDYRRLVEAAAARYGVGDRRAPGRGRAPTRSSTSSPRRSSRPGDRAVVPAPTYAMYRVCTEQRGATVVSRPAPWARRRLGAGRRRPSGRRPPTRRSSGCAAPTTRPRWPSRTERSPGCSTGSPATPRAAGRERADRRPRRGLRRIRRDRRWLGLRDGYPNLIVVRTISKAYALAGLRVGFAVARPEVIARINPYRPPGSVSVISVTIATEALLDDTILAANLARVARERARLSDGARPGRLDGRPIGHQLRAGRLRDARAGRRTSPRRCCAAASCRARSPAGIRSPAISASRSATRTRTTG